MQILEQLKHWHSSLPPRDMWLVNLMTAFVFITLFYLIAWEPVHNGLADEKVKHEAQEKLLQWMTQSAQEVRQLRAGGGATQIKQANKPVTLVLEQSLTNAGLKPFVTKIESAGNSNARVKLDNVSFDQMLVWLNTIATHNGIIVSSAVVERGDKPGRANARLSFSRP